MFPFLETIAMLAITTTRLPGLDILRLIAALMVVGYHYGFRMAMTGEGGEVIFPELLPLAMWGDTGVLIFFAVSGYVIAMSVQTRTAFEFVVSRFARLWPGFVVCASLTALILWLLPLPSLPKVTLGQWLAQGLFWSKAFGYPFMDGVYWSIVFELVFYGWVALLVATGLYHRHLNLVLLLWLSVSIVNEAVFGNDLLRALLLTGYAGYFAFGILLYRAESTMDWRIVGLFVLALAHILFSRFQFEDYIVKTYQFQRDAGWVAISGPLAVVAVVLASGVRHLPLFGRFAMTLGAMTYPLYLLHQNIGYTIFNRYGTMQNRWLLGFALVGLLLALSWRIGNQVEPVARRAVEQVLYALHGAVMRLVGRKSHIVPGE